MPQACDKCGAVQPIGVERCGNCGAKLPVPLHTSQGTQVTLQQLRDYALTILAIVFVTLLFFGVLVVSCVLLGR